MSQETCVVLLLSNLNKYNNTKPSTTDISPRNSNQGQHNIGIWLTLYSKTHFNRKYPPLKRETQLEHISNLQHSKQDTKVLGVQMRLR